MIIYHYHAFYQDDDKTTVHIDGILTCDKPLLNMSEYKKVKKVISPENADRLTISSLSILKAGHD